jgi:multidrug transporter EmrE-like cation transporter
MTSWVRYPLAALVVLAVVALGALSLAAEPPAGVPGAGLVVAVLDPVVLVWLAVALFSASFACYRYYLRGEDPERRVYEGESVEALVPVYRDADVMDRSVERLADSPYEDLTVTIVVEPDDDASRTRAKELAESHDRVRTLVNDERQGSKAGALNYAIERSDADVLALFDADQQPHPELIPHSMAYLEDADLTRVRSVPDPSGGLIESATYYEYLLLYFLPQKLARLVLGLNMAGTRSILLRRSVFDTVGLFAEDTLTEDLDFAHRVHQAGLHNRELLYYPSFEAPAHTLGDWWGQRLRWMTGSVEVGHDQLRKWTDVFDPDVLGSVLTAVGTVVAGVLLAVTVPKLAVGLVTDPLLVGSGLAVLCAVQLLTRAVDHRTAGLDGYGLGWLLFPLVFTGFGLVIVQSVVGYVAGSDRGWYSIDKEA